MKITKFPIIYIAVSFAAGIIIDNEIRLKITAALLVFFIAFLVFLAATIKAKKDLVQKKYWGFIALLTTICCGILTHAIHSENNYSNHYSNKILEKENQKITGTITERLKPNTHSEKYFFKVTSINDSSSFGKILLHLPKKEYDSLLKGGDELCIYGDLQQVPKSVNPFQFNYAEYLEKQQVYYQLFLKKRNFKIISHQQNLDHYVEQYREILLKSFEKHHFSESTYQVIRALLLGQRQDMDAAINQNYTDAGVIHILAISGLHIAILYAILLFVLKPLSRYRQGRFLQFAISLSFLWCFALLSGLSASVVRSVVMFSFMSLAVYLNKSSSIYNSMAASLLAILLFKPNLLLDVGFQLSYAAVFSIVWLQPLFKKLHFSENCIVKYLVDMVLISLIAQLGVLPISLYYFHQFPSLFLVANLVVIPLSSFVLIYGICILVLNFVLPEAALFLGKFLALSIEWMNHYIAWVASFKTLTIKGIPFSLPLTISLYLVIVTGALFLYEKNFRRITAFLISGFAFQLLLLFSFQQSKTTDEFIIFNNKKATLFTTKTNELVHVYSNDTLPAKNENLKNYNRGNFNLKLQFHSLQNVIFYKQQKILIVDSIGTYRTVITPDIIVLVQSPKINLNRLIKEVKPKQIIADGTNYKNYVKRWKASCEKEKIPFHATSEKGFYRIN